MTHLHKLILLELEHRRMLRPAPRALISVLLRSTRSTSTALPTNSTRITSASIRPSRFTGRFQYFTPGEESAYLTGREPVMRMSTSLLALCCQSGLVATLATPISARSRSIGSRSLRMSPLFIARFTRARIASQIRA